MINEHITYPENVRNATRELYDFLKKNQYEPEIVLGDIHGPSRYAMSVKVPFRRSFMILECNTGSWRVSFHPNVDEACAHGVLFDTEYSLLETEDFAESLRDFSGSLI